MDKTSRILFAIICALLAFWFLTQKPEEPVVAKDSSQKKKMTSPPQRSLLQKTKNPETGLQDKASSSAQKNRVQKQVQPQSLPATVSLPASRPAASMPPYRSGFMRWKSVNGWALAHGDILLGKISDAKKVQFGHFKPRPNKLWPSNKIAYSIHKDVPNSQVILDAIDYFNNNTVMKFYPHKGETHVLVFVAFDKGHCASYLGKVLPQQPIMLSNKCGVNEVIHEIMHALGFVHEQSRPDRDKYVEILYDKIQDEFVNQYDLISDSLIHDFTGSVFFFDYNSIMLYNSTAFAKVPGETTMRSQTSTEVPNAKQGLSSTDIERLYFLYGD